LQLFFNFGNPPPGLLASTCPDRHLSRESSTGECQNNGPPFFGTGSSAWPKRKEEDESHRVLTKCMTDASLRDRIPLSSAFCNKFTAVPVCKQRPCSRHPLGGAQSDEMESHWMSMVDEKAQLYTNCVPQHSEECPSPIGEDRMVFLIQNSSVSFSRSCNKEQNNQLVGSYPPKSWTPSTRCRGALSQWIGA
jgi:hypothetical protein